MLNFLAYTDGSLSVLETADKICVPMWDLTETIEKLKMAGLLETAG
jgi:aminopeptidase-like protein